MLHEIMFTALSKAACIILGQLKKQARQNGYVLPAFIGPFESIGQD